MKQQDSKYVITARESKLIQTIKFICAVMVVFIHTVSGIYLPERSQAMTLLGLSHFIRFVLMNFVFICAVPTFFTISGMLLYRKPFSWRNNLRKKVQTVLIPYLCINTFWILFYFATQSIPSLKSSFNTQDLYVSSWGITEWIKAYIGGIIKEPDKWYGPAMGWLWFLRDLFVLNLLAPIIKYVVDKFPRCWFCLLSALWIVVGTINSSWYRLVTSFLFFSLGYGLVKYNIHLEDAKDISHWLLWVTWTGGCLLGCLFQRENRYLYGIGSMLCILAGSCLLVRLSEWLLGRRFKWLDLFSGYSMAIYLFHERSLTIVIRVIEKIWEGGSDWLLPQGFIAISMIVWSICISKVLEKLQPKIYKILIGGR